jgi:uncharacterized protein (TIGR03118 family)
MRIYKDFRKLILITVGGVGALVSLVPRAEAGPYVQTNLVSDIPGLAALTDPALINPWGVSESPTSPFWVSDQGTNVSTLYTVNGSGVSKSGLVVSVPTTTTGPQGPTGQVNNTSGSFVVAGKAANFIFANLNGTISAWNSNLGTAAQIQVATPGAVYTGLAIDPTGGRLYAANGAQNRIDVFNGSFASVALLPNAFVDPNLPAGFVPFNVEMIGSKVYVTYAPPTRDAQTSATAGMGVVSVFDTNGKFLQQLVAGGPLASPWGLALAPSGFGPFGGDLLVGNFSFANSEINAFDPMTGALLGTIPIDVGANAPGGLWDLAFGNGGSGGDPNKLYFTDGIDGEADGLFGSLAPVPEPSGLWLMALGLIPVWLGRRARR